MTWPLALRVAFRFWFLYVLAFASGMLPFWKPVVTEVGRRFLGTTIVVQENGSGDTTFHYVQVFCWLVIAAVGALVWSLIDRRSKHHTALFGVQRAGVRYLLGFALILYGMIKVFKTQFPFQPDALERTLGELSPMGLLWNFMGFSEGYNRFAGLAELIPGLLLFYRRTALAGALLAAAAMSNVVALNFFYDVPVKLLSMHLMLFAIFLILPDAARLLRVLLEESGPQSLLAGARKWNLAWQVSKALLLAALIVSLGMQAGSDPRMLPSLDPSAGNYSVVSMNIPGCSQPQWQTVTLPRGVIRLRDGGEQRGMLKISLAQHLASAQLCGDIRQFQVLDVEPKGSLQLKSKDGGVIELRRKFLADYRLTGRGFHWINEYPFNH